MLANTTFVFFLLCTPDHWCAVPMPVPVYDATVSDTTKARVYAEGRTVCVHALDSGAAIITVHAQASTNISIQLAVEHRGDAYGVRDGPLGIAPDHCHAP